VVRNNEGQKEKSRRCIQKGVELNEKKKGTGACIRAGVVGEGKLSCWHSKKKNVRRVGDYNNEKTGEETRNKRILTRELTGLFKELKEGDLDKDGKGLFNQTRPRTRQDRYAGTEKNRRRVDLKGAKRGEKKKNHSAARREKHHKVKNGQRHETKARAEDGCWKRQEEKKGA